MITINSISQLRDHLQGLKAVVFDLDDTLYSEKEYVYSGYQAIACALPEVDGMAEKLWEAFLRKKLPIDEVLVAEGIYTEILKQKCLSVYRFHQPNIHLYVGARELLQKLRTEGYLLGIITDGRPEGQRAKLKALGLFDLVDHIIITDELGGPAFRKPNEAAFVTMRQMLNVPFGKIAYIADNIKKDFIAPQKLGMLSIHFKNENGLYTE